MPEFCRNTLILGDPYYGEQRMFGCERVQGHEGPHLHSEKSDQSYAHRKRVDTRWVKWDMTWEDTDA